MTGPQVYEIQSHLANNLLVTPDQGHGITVRRARCADGDIILQPCPKPLAAMSEAGEQLSFVISCGAAQQDAARREVEQHLASFRQTLEGPVVKALTTRCPRETALPKPTERPGE